MMDDDLCHKTDIGAIFRTSLEHDLSIDDIFFLQWKMICLSAETVFFIVGHSNFGLFVLGMLRGLEFCKSNP